MELFITLGIAALLGLIPANIAKKKGHSFGLWWFYGWMLFIVAIIHVFFIEDYNAPKQQSASGYPASGVGTADEIRKYRELADQGAITEEEFQEKKRQLLQVSGGAAGPSSGPDYSGTRSAVNDPVPSTATPAAAVAQSVHPIIYCTGGQYVSRKIPLTKSSVIVGRQPDCGIRFEDGTPGISGRHCVVGWDSARAEFIVRDLGSKYGTFLKGGRRLPANQPCRIQVGEVLTLGDPSNTLQLETE